MMDKETILENGLLEKYILGELKSEEALRVEDVLAKDSSLRDLYDQLEIDFEQLGLENAILPPPEVKSDLMAGLSASEAKIIELPAKPSAHRFKFLFAIAASLAAMLLVSSFWMYTQMDELQNTIQTVQTENTELDTTISELNEQLHQNSELYAAITHPDTEQYILQGNALMPEGKAVGYVNHTMKSVVVNSERLPELDENHDYQMWADVEGEMINMGVIPKDQELIAMTYIEDSESLNITIENAGGNDHPTVERLVTNVYLK